MSIPSKSRTLSIVLKTLTFVSAAAGVIITATSSAGTFMGGSRVFMFFTIQSNIAIAVLCLAGGILLLRNKKVGSVWLTVKLAGTVSITLTGVVFAVMLAPILGNRAWNVQNTLTHVVVPIAAVADFFTVAAGSRIKRKNVLYVIVPPLCYVIYAGIGYIRGWEFIKGQNYPYFFLNWGSPAGVFGFSKGLPYLGVGWWLLILLLFLIGIGWCYAALAERMGSGSGHKEADR